MGECSARRACRTFAWYLGPATMMIPAFQKTAFEYIVGPLAMSFNRSFRQK
ncbi:protein of unknown function [Bradyrhizobium vignae]|uniref:Uncharacterized protein n=1 Tax=Bradyrhizobium vignae TaxID=1549949 RepID=A0A2U3Q869_9BRAD|nr:protein of unknown function [Bradyrhizobium vignae]